MAIVYGFFFGFLFYLACILDSGLNKQDYQVKSIFWSDFLIFCHAMSMHVKKCNRQSMLSTHRSTLAGVEIPFWVLENTLT